MDTLVVMSQAWVPDVGRVVKVGTRTKVLPALTCHQSVLVAESTYRVVPLARMATATASVSKKGSYTDKASRPINYHHFPRSLATAHTDPPTPKRNTVVHETASQTRRRPSLLRWRLRSLRCRSSSPSPSPVRVTDEGSTIAKGLLK
jgi:hypothetical protein